MKILGICGSLRSQSSNGLLLRAAKGFFEKTLVGSAWTEFNLSALPYFDADLQFSEDLPPAVKAFREMASSADLIFISTPEYAHGPPGLLKNALEWVFHEGTSTKPVALVIGGAEGEFARDQLLEILRTMDFTIQEQDAYLLKGARSKLNGDGSFKDPADQTSFDLFCRRFIKAKSLTTA